MVEEEKKKYGSETQEGLALEHLRQNILRGYENLICGNLILTWEKDPITGDLHPWITTKEWMEVAENTRTLAKKLDSDLQSDKSVHPIIKQAMKGMMEQNMPYMMQLVQEQLGLTPIIAEGEEEKNPKNPRKNQKAKKSAKERIQTGKSGITCDVCGDRHTVSQVKIALESGKMKCSCGNDLTRAARALLDAGDE